jgi:hypothetical protein
MPHSFPKGEMPAEIKWGRPPGLRGTPSSRSLCGCGCLGARRGRPGGRPRTWASAPLFAQMSESGKTMRHWAIVPAGRLWPFMACSRLALSSMMPDGDEAEESRAQARGPLPGISADLEESRLNACPTKRPKSRGRLKGGLQPGLAAPQNRPRQVFDRAPLEIVWTNQKSCTRFLTLPLKLKVPREPIGKHQ